MAKNTFECLMAQTAKGFNTEIGNKIQYDNVTLKYSILYFSKSALDNLNRILISDTNRLS